MGIFDRFRGRSGSGDGSGAVDATADDGASADAMDVAPVEEILTRALTTSEQEQLDAARARYADHDIDPGHLDSIAAAYDRALAKADGAEGAEESDVPDVSDVVAVISVALGDHLVDEAGYRWVVSTDPFGSDLAVAPPRRGAPVVTRTLVAVRWMSQESGWIPGVAQHLARAGNR